MASRITPHIISYYLKPFVFFLLSIPLLWLAYGWWDSVVNFSNILSANPIEYTNRFLGDWALRILLLALAVTPVADISGSKVPTHFRRMIGLFAFTYVAFHVSSYVVLDHFFNWTEIWKDIVKRNFITVGMIAFILLIPLAVTSTSKMIKRLGAKRWKTLHKSVYAIGILGTIHYIMMVRGDQDEPIIYMSVLALLLGYRAWKWKYR